MMMGDLTANLQEIASNAKAWPFAEARALASRLDKMGNAKDEVLFETGYGPSGLPHIGTFGEVVRTTMVRYAFESLTGRKTRLIWTAFARFQIMCQIMKCWRPIFICH
jgi:lysyl-tRNA synthetase class 1